MAKVMVTNYVFGLFDNHDQLIDQTNINEDDPNLAWELFVDFSKSPQESYKNIENPDFGYYTSLIAEEPEEVDEDDL